jgi:hypothetical protein
VEDDRVELAILAEESALARKTGAGSNPITSPMPGQRASSRQTASGEALPL